MRRSKKRTYAGVGLMGLGIVGLVAANTNCLSDDEIPYFVDVGDDACVTSIRRTSRGTSTHYEGEIGLKPRTQRLYSGFLFVSGLLLATVWADVPVKVDTRQDGIHLSKSFSW